jgi:carbonic anhydrase
MSTLDSMLERNKDFAARQSAAGTLMPSLPDATPNLKAMIIGCADMRVDPAHLLGLKPGEALVLRNIGGRITPVLLQELGMLGRIGQVMGKVAGGGGEFHLIVLHHTDCGITRLAGDPPMLKSRKGTSRQRRSPIPARRLSAMLPGSRRFPRCRASGLFPASSTTWRPDWLRSSYRQRRFVLRSRWKVRVRCGLSSRELCSCRVGLRWSPVRGPRLLFPIRSAASSQ